jgi:ankyrin repeat protein/beta-lactamase regulating signal transducer with metallopeptidase domain
LNNIGRVFCDYAAGVFVQSALLVILLLVVELLLRKRVRAVFRYCLWMLVLVKLVLPPMLSLPTGIGYWVGDHLPAAFSISDRAFDVARLERMSLSGEMPQVRPPQNITEIDALTAPAASALTPLTWQAILFVLWLVGVLAFLVVLVQRVRFVRGLIAVSSPATEKMLGLLEQCRRQIGVRWDIRLRISDTIPSPAVCGLLRPTVLIPAPLVEKLSPEGLRATLIHELAHIKRGDLWVNSFQTFLQVIYFYNPFVWFANAVIRRVCEEAVDETVLVTLGGQAKNYSNTLIDIGEMAFWRADLGLRLIGVAESRKALQWRIRHMLTRPIPKSSKLGALGIIAIFTIAAVLLPMAKAEKSTEDNKPVATESERKPTKSLHQAVADGDIEQVKKFIAAGADVNARDNQSLTPLHFAAKGGHEEIARLLIAEGANVNVKMVDDSWTPLLTAAKNGHTKLVKLLLEKGAKVDVGDDYGYTPLYYSIWSDDEESVRMLIAAGADVNRRVNEKDEYNAFFEAVWMGDAGIVKALIDADANVNYKDKGGRTPLHDVIEAADADVAKLFVGTGVNISAFYNAVLEGNLAKVTQLVESGTDVDTKDEFGWTPSYWALSAGQKKVFAYLLSQGADVTAKTNDGCTLLHQACKAGFTEIVKQLISKGVEVDAKPDSGNTPLKIAAGDGHEEIVKLLISKGADVNATSYNGRHPLGDAALAGHEEVVKLLIASGAEANLHAEGRGSALHAAARGGHSTILDILIANGADVNINARNGTPLHLAAGARGSVNDEYAKIVEKLLAKGADVNAKSPRQGRTPLHAAVDKGRYKTARLLIAAGANVNATDNEGKTPLSEAPVNSKIFNLLRKHGAKE